MKRTITKIRASFFAVACLFISLNSNAQVQDINTVAGNGTGGYSGDGGQATAAELNSRSGGGFGGGGATYELGVTVDDSGNFYIADAGNNRIRKVAVSTGIITTVAGSGGAGFGGGGGFSGDGGPATAAKLNRPEGVAVDGSGNIYIADYENQRIREVSSTTGDINTVAGNGTAGYNSDGIAATDAELDDPTGVAVDDSGNFYIADEGNHRIRKVEVSTGIISTVAGSGTSGFNGNGGPATLANLASPSGVAVDQYGNIYLIDATNSIAQEVSSDTINIIAGTGTTGYSGDGGPAIAAELKNPFGIAVDNAGNVYIADENNSVIRKVNTSDTINTIAGDNTAGYSGDGGPATAAELNYPTGVVTNDSGIIYIADAENNRIRAVYQVVAPVAGILVDSVGCVNTTIQFTGSYPNIGAKPSSWKWTFTGGTPATSTLQNPLVTYATAGTYTVELIASNAAGADTIIDANLITINPLPTVTAAPTTDTICAGYTITLSSNGALTYTWAPATGLSASTGASISATPVANTTYTVTGTDENGCKNTAKVAVTTLAAARITVTSSSNPVCNGYPVTLTAKNGNNNVTGIVYSWIPNITLSSTIGTSVTAVPTTATTYTVIGTDTTDGCADSAAVSVSIYGGAGFGYSVSGYQLSLSMDSIGICAADGYQWNYGNGITNTESPNPLYTYSSSGGYTVCLRCNDDSTCPQCVNITLPGNYSGNTNTGIDLVSEAANSINIFPNPSDGIFTLYIDNLAGNPKLEVYNTLGQLIYQSIDINSKQQLNLSTEPAGMYFIYLKSDEGVSFEKLLITK